MEERLAKIAENFFEFFKGDYIIHVVEIIFAFALFYYVLRVLHDNKSRKFMWAYSLIITGATVLALLAAGIDLNLYLEFLMLISMFFLFLFSFEIKRSGEDKNKRPRNNFSEDKTIAETEACIAAIIKAVQNMSKNDTGAIIILANDNIPKPVIDSGVMLESKISSQLIEGIFVNKAPLHDGALIINGHSIKAAGCFLPISQNPALPKDLGSRHRAAIGISEVTDVTVIVVSEETGIISTIEDGVISRFADHSTLRNVLAEYYFDPLGKPKKMAGGNI